MKYKYMITRTQVTEHGVAKLFFSEVHAVIL